MLNCDGHWKVMHQDLAGGKYYRKKGKVCLGTRIGSCKVDLAPKRLQVEKVRKQFTADIRMVESRHVYFDCLLELPFTVDLQSSLLGACSQPLAGILSAWTRRCWSRGP